MQEINLLQNKLKDKTHQWETNNRVVVVLMSLVLLAALLATGAFYMLKKNAEDSKATLDQENVTLQRKLDSMEARLVDAKSFQAQTKNITNLLNTHIISTALVSELATKTFKGSRYLSMTTETSGLINIEGITPTYIELGKMLLALETSDKFTSVRLVSTAPSTSELSGVMYSIEVMVGQNIFLEGPQ